MRKINLSTTKCTNPKCNFRILSETVMSKCPVCKSKTIKDKQFTSQVLFDDDCIILKEKGRKSDSHRPRDFKK